MTRAEHAAFIRGLEAARRLAYRTRRFVRTLGNASHAGVAAQICNDIDFRIWRERKKARAK